ncbi:hypothetical protein Tco_1011123, partial [Tanacetum coccineum]
VVGRWFMKMEIDMAKEIEKMRKERQSCTQMVLQGATGGGILRDYKGSAFVAFSIFYGQIQRHETQTLFSQKEDIIADETPTLLQS